MSLLRAPDNVEQLHPSEVMRWAFDTYGVDNVAVTSSFEDAVLVHLAVGADPKADIVLLDTQYLFAETWWLAEEMQTRFDINLAWSRLGPKYIATIFGRPTSRDVAPCARSSRSIERWRARPRGSPAFAGWTARPAPTHQW